MKSALKSTLVSAAMFAALSSASAVTFTYTDFSANLSGTTSSATVGGITAYLSASDTLGNAALKIQNSGTATYLGVSGNSDQQNTNLNQANRISDGQFLALSFNQAVTIGLLGFNNLIGVEKAIITTSGNAFTNLTGYTDPYGTTQSDVSSEGLVWGYDSPTFNIQLTTGSGSNLSQDIIFGTGTGGNNTITLAAGDTVTFTGYTGGSPGAGGSGGYGLNSFRVTAVPEPSTCAWRGLARSPQSPPGVVAVASTEFVYVFYLHRGRPTPDGLLI